MFGIWTGHSASHGSPHGLGHGCSQPFLIRIQYSISSSKIDLTTYRLRKNVSNDVTIDIKSFSYLMLRLTKIVIIGVNFGFNRGMPLRFSSVSSWRRHSSSVELQINGFGDVVDGILKKIWCVGFLAKFGGGGGEFCHLPRTCRVGGCTNSVTLNYKSFTPFDMFRLGK
jgi:hypothetical protein